MAFGFVSGAGAGYNLKRAKDIAVDPFDIKGKTFGNDKDNLAAKYSNPDPSSYTRESDFPYAIKPNGSVAGVSTSSRSTSPDGSSSGGSWGDPGLSDADALAAMEEEAREEEEKRIKKFRRNTRNAYSGFRGGLSDILGASNQDRDRYTGGVGDLQKNYKGALSSTLQGQNEILDRQRTDVQDDQRENLRGLADNVRSSLRQGNNYLGALGAGNSSATGLYQKAVMSQANESREDVREQASVMFADIKTKEAKAQKYYDLEVEEIDRWAEDSSANIISDFQEQRAEIDSLRNDADDYEQDDLDDLDQKNLETAYNRMQEVETRRSGWQNTFDTWRTNINDQIKQEKQALIEMTEFSPEDLELPELDDSGYVEMDENPEDILLNRVKTTKRGLETFRNNPFTDQEDLFA